MSLNAQFTTRAGIALVRRPQSDTNGWVFVRWLFNEATDITLDTPGTGTWVYAIWAVVGRDNPSVESANRTAGKSCSIVTSEMKR